MPFFEATDGTQLFYTDWPGGTPTVFVAAWGLSDAMWNCQIPEFTDAGLRCITYDRRGHGRSDRPGHGYDFDTLADDLASLINALELTDITLIGHSMGAGEVARYLTRHGSARVARVVLSAPNLPFLRATPDNPDGADDETLAAQRDLMRRDIGAWIDAASAVGSYFGAEANVSDDVWNWTRRQITDTSVEVLVRTTLANTHTDFRPELRRVDVPTLVIHGSADFSAPIELTGRKVAALVPDSRLVVIEGAGHGLYQSYSRRYNAEILEFGGVRASP